jgi:hypothetical protein
MSKGNGGGSYRSAGTGRYVTAAHGRCSPGTTVHEAPGRSGLTGGSYRSAGTGRFVTAAHGRRSPGTTTHEK